MQRVTRSASAIAFVLCGLFAGIAFAQSDYEFWPGADYDPSIPTIKGVLGYESGERITWHRDTIRYFEALRDAVPERVALFRYAESWEGRELIYAVITSPENMARIDDVKANMQRLADPRKTSRAAADAIIENQPAVTWLSYSVHGLSLIHI